MRTQWELAVSGVSFPGGYDPVLWQSVHGTATDTYELVCERVIRDVTEAVEVHRELEGMPLVPPECRELCALSYALAAVALERAATTTEEFELLLQSVAAKLYHRFADRRSESPEAFWSFLRHRARTLYRDPRVGRRGYDLSFYTDRFLELCGLGGEGNEDVVVSVARLIAPHLHRGLEAAGRRIDFGQAQVN